MGMDESLAALDYMDKRLGRLQQANDALAPLQGFLGGAPEQIGAINASDARQYNEPIQIASGPATGPIDFVNQPQPEPAQPAPAPQPSAAPQSVAEADPFMTLPKNLRSLADFKTNVLGMDAEPQLWEHFFGDGKHGRAARIYEQELEKEFDQLRKDRSKQRFTLQDAETQFPGAIKPTESQLSYPARPSMMAPPTDAPSKFRYAEPQRVLNETQHAALASLIGGHLMNNGNGQLEPPSVVNNRMDNAPISPAVQRQELDILQNQLRNRSAGPGIQGSDGDAIDIPGVSVNAKPTPLLEVPPRVYKERMDNVTKIGLAKGERAANAQSPIGKIFADRDKYAVGSPEYNALQAGADHLLLKDTDVAQGIKDELAIMGVTGNPTPLEVQKAQSMMRVKKLIDVQDESDARAKSNLGGEAAREMLFAQTGNKDFASATPEQAMNAIKAVQKMKVEQARMTGAATVAEHPVEEGDRTAITALMQNIRVIDTLESEFTPEQRKEYAGLVNLPLNRLRQLRDGDPKFARFYTLLKEQGVAAFEIGGKQFTGMEKQIVFGFLPTGSEWSPADFEAKLKAARDHSQFALDNRITLATEPRKNLRGKVDKAMHTEKASKPELQDLVNGSRPK